jgi:hypothetical protein
MDAIARPAPEHAQRNGRMSRRRSLLPAWQGAWTGIRTPLRSLMPPGQRVRDLLAGKPS